MHIKEMLSKDFCPYDDIEDIIEREERIKGEQLRRDDIIRGIE